MDKIDFTIIRYGILSCICVRLIWNSKSSLLFNEVYEHFPSKAKWITAYRRSINILLNQSTISIWSENLFVLIIEQFGNLLCPWFTLCPYISLCTRIEWLCKSKVVLDICFNFFRTISDLYSTLIHRLEIGSLSSIRWLCSLRFIFESIINEWFHCCIVLIKFGNSFFLGNRVFKSAD